MASAQAAHPVKKNATKIRPRKASARANSTFVLAVDTPPMEARAAEVVPCDGERWQYEPKWDGFRCLAFKSGDAIDLRAKSGKPLGRYFPEVVSLLRDIGTPQFVVDGELVIETEGRLAFDVLQMRLHPAESRIRKLSVETPARLILFDMLVDTDGRKLIGEPLEQRREALEAFLAQASVPKKIVLSPFTRDRHKAEEWLNESGHGATDGIVAKRLKDPYAPGARTMIKVKGSRTADCVVGGFRYETNSRQVGSLLLGLYDEEGKLDHVGFTSTIMDVGRANLTRRLEGLRAPPAFTGKAPGGPSRWSTDRGGEWEPLRPELVVEVRFDHVSGHRFRHGTKLMRWRPDKAPRQCTFEQINVLPAAVKKRDDSAKL